MLLPQNCLQTHKSVATIFIVRLQKFRSEAKLHVFYELHSLLTFET